MKEIQRREQIVAKNKLYYGPDYHDYGLLFCQDNGDPIEPSIMGKWFRKWQRRRTDLGLPFITFHALRHTYATIMMELCQGNVKTVQDFTGHADAIMILQRYAHMQTEPQKLLTQLMEDTIYKNPRRRKQRMTAFCRK